MLTWKVEKTSLRAYAHGVVLYNDSLHYLCAPEEDNAEFSFLTKYDPVMRTWKLSRRIEMKLDVYFHLHRWKNELYIFSNQRIDKVNLDTFENEVVCNTNPPFRCATCQVGDSVYTFGGQRRVNDRYIGEISEMMKFSFVEQTFVSIAQKGDIPCPRRFATMIHHQGSLFLFGGRDRRLRYSDLFEFKIKTNTWRKLEVLGDAPNPRSSQSMVKVGTSIFVWGGKNTDDPRETLDQNLYEYSIPFNIWKRVLCDGDVPKGTYWHATMLLDYKLYIHGGTEDWDAGPVHRELYTIYLIPSYSHWQLDYSMYHLLGVKCKDVNFYFK